MLPLASLVVAAGAPRHTLQDRVARLAQLRAAAPPPSPGRAPAGGFDRTYDATGLPPLPPAVVRTPRPEEYVTDVPAEWDWRAVSLGDGLPAVSYTTEIRNQFLPKWCGSCWAHAAAAVMGSRRRIHQADDPGISAEISVQHLVNCVNESNSRGCGGGSSYGAFAHAHSVGAVDNSCLAYAAETQECTAMHTCQQHLSSKAKDAEAVAPVKYFVEEYGHLPDEDAMMKEIYARGPIACCQACPGEFEAYTSGVYVTSSSRSVCDHITAVVGYGGGGSGAYWLVQNSFGAVWGEGGFFRIKRGSALAKGEYNLGIEKSCSWSMPR